MPDAIAHDKVLEPLGAGGLCEVFRAQSAATIAAVFRRVAAILDARTEAEEAAVVLFVLAGVVATSWMRRP